MSRQDELPLGIHAAPAEPSLPEPRPPAPEFPPAERPETLSNVQRALSSDPTPRLFGAQPVDSPELPSELPSELSSELFSELPADPPPHVEGQQALFSSPAPEPSPEASPPSPEVQRTPTPDPLSIPSNLSPSRPNEQRARPQVHPAAPHHPTPIPKPPPQPEARHSAAGARRTGAHRQAARPRGLSASHLLAFATLSSATLAAADIALTQRLSLFFDLCFVLLSLLCAMLARRDAFFTAGVLPPLLMATVVGGLSLADPQTITSTHLAFVSTWLTGLAHHGAGLVAAHIVALVVIGLRVAHESQRPQYGHRLGHRGGA